MKIIMTRTESEFNRTAARIIAKQLIKRSKSVLSLDATLITEGIYHELASYSKLLQLDWTDVRVCSTYEFIDADENEPCSVAYRLNKLLFEQVNIDRDNIFIPDSFSKNAAMSCKNFESAVKSLNCIDMQILEIGQSGAIAMNEPNTAFKNQVYVADIDKNIFNQKAHFEKNTFHPAKAITMGPKLLMQAKTQIIVAKGSEKARLVKDVLTGEITPAVPASVLQLHPNVIVLLDEGAASMMW